MDGSSAPLNNGGTADMSVLLLMSIDPSFDPESVHGPSSQQFDRSSDPRRGQPVSRPTAPSEPNSTVRDVPVGLGDGHHHGKYISLNRTTTEADTFKDANLGNVAPSVGAPLSASETIPLFTPVAASVQWVYLRKSAGRTRL